MQESQGILTTEQDDSRAAWYGTSLLATGEADHRKSQPGMGMADHDPYDPWAKSDPWAKRVGLCD